MYDLSIENSINTVEDIKRMQLYIDDKVIALSDIAKVENDLKFEDEYFYNLNKAISLAVIKSPNHSEKDFIITLDNIINDLHTEYPNTNVSKTK